MLKWQLTGTANQIGISQSIFERVKFPLDRLRLPGVPEFGWRDLNRRANNPILQEIEKQHALNGRHKKVHDKSRHHDDHVHEDTYEPLYGYIEGRRYILGVFYPYSGRIYIDTRLESKPEIAQSVGSAELGHAVDEFLPLTDYQREQIMRACHGGHLDHHTWWEKIDYSTEYFSLIGETFMILFTKAYTDIPFGDVSSFVHTGENVTPEQIRAIIGIERTDAALKPIPNIKHFLRGKDIYHRLTHYPKKPGEPVYDLAGFRGCKVCKPVVE